MSSITTSCGSRVVTGSGRVACLKILPVSWLALSAEGEESWRLAREQDDFSAFAPRSNA